MDGQDVPHDELADFLLVASRLIYLKSRELMPYLVVDEEEEKESLEDQLRMYRLFVEAAERLEGLYKGEAQGFIQPFIRSRRKSGGAGSGSAGKEAGFMPPAGLVQEDMKLAFHSVLKRLEPFFALQEASIQRVKSVEERIEELHVAIRSRASISFKEAMKGAKSRADVVVSFLALLELVRRQLVKARQNSDNDIVIERI
jgi:segregation and condensation protein A